MQQQQQEQQCIPVMKWKQCDYVVLLYLSEMKTNLTLTTTTPEHTITMQLHRQDTVS